MKTLKLISVFFWVSAFAQAQTSSKTFELKDFTKLQIGGSYTITLKKGAFSIKLSGKTEDVNNIRAEVNNGELSFFQKEKKMISSRLTLEIQMPQLQAVNLSGAVKATSEAFKYDNFTVYLSGNSEALILSEAVKTYIDLSGTCSLTLKGKTTDIQANITGASKLNAFEYPADNVKIEVVGTSGAEIFVNKNLTASAIGTAKIRYKGSAQNVVSNAKGISSIKKE